MRGKIRVGTRGSRLAMAQTETVVTALRAAAPGIEFELVPIRTEGDRVQQGPLPSWGKGVFVREIEIALLEHRIDLAVHSLKDVPPSLPEGLALLATPARADPRDVIITRSGLSFAALPAGSRVGTSSLRRSAFLRALRPDLEYGPIRGNVDTRLAKLRDPELGYDAIVLAAAGLDRLGLLDVPREYLEPDVLLPAPGQGVLVVEGRADDEESRHLAEQITDRATAAAVEAERALLLALQGGCRLPVAALATVTADKLRLDAAVATFDGRRVLREHIMGEVETAAALGRTLAQRLLSCGAADLVESAGRGDTW